MSDTDQPAFNKNEDGQDADPNESAQNENADLNAPAAEGLDQNAGDAPEAKESGDEQNDNEPKDEDDAPTEEATGGLGGGNQTISLNDLYHIRLNKRLPYLDNGPIKAYEAYSSANKNLFAMICERFLPPRFKDTEVYLKNTESALLKYVTSGTVFWAPEGIEKHVVIYEGNPGKPILESMSGAAMGLKPEQVMKGFLKPVIEALRGLRDLDLYHGHVRLDNIYGATDDGFDRVSLGDCLSLPAGYAKNTIFLTPQKALASMAGRGLGSISDDLYALGVCTAIMLRSADPAKNLTEKEIIKMKLAQGSYMTLTNKDRFSGGILELLRGLLQDDPAQRWTMDEVLAWMDGQRLVPKPSVKRPKAGRPIVLRDQRYYYTETLAMDMPDYLSDAAAHIEGDGLDQWISRSIEDTRMVEKLEVGIRMAREYGRTNFYHDRLISRICIILAPKQPIRYRGYSLFPDGFGTAIAEAFKSRKEMSPFVHMINQQIVPYWLDLQAEVTIDVGAIAVAFENCRNSLKQNQAGYGLERCLYVLSPECPCLSEQYERYLIREAKDFLMALNDMSKKGRMPRDVFDPHITAFLLVRNNRIIDSFIPELSSPEGYRRILGTIKTLSTIQKATDSKDLKELTRWAAKYVKPFFDRYHDRKIREEKIEEIEKIKNKGDLKAFVKIMDDPKALQQDSIEFKKAIRDYYKLKLENYKFEKSLANSETYGVSSGRELAAILSGVLASIIVLVLTFIFFSGGGVIP